MLIHGAPVLWLPGKTAIWRVRWVVVATVPYTKNTEGSVDVANGTWYHHTPDGWKVDSNSFILLSLCSIDKNAVWALNLLFVHQSHFPRFSPFIVYAEVHIPWKYVTIWRSFIFRYAYALYPPSSTSGCFIWYLCRWVTLFTACGLPKELVLAQITCLLPGLSLVDQWWKFEDRVSFYLHNSHRRMPRIFLCFGISHLGLVRCAKLMSALSTVYGSSICFHFVMNLV